jgi:hypothetical protein
MIDLDEIQGFYKTCRALDLKPRTVQFEIDGLMYTSTKVATSIGVELGPRVVAMGLQVFLGDGLNAAAFLRVIDRLIAEGVNGLARALLDQTRCSSVAGGDGGLVLPKYDDHFAGEYGHLRRVLVFVGVHNFLGPSRGAL